MRLMSFLVLSAFVVLLASCTSITRHNDKAAYKYELKAPIVVQHDILKANVEVGKEKISGTSKTKYFGLPLPFYYLTLFTWGDNGIADRGSFAVQANSDYEKKAVFNACKDSDVDSLIEAHYEYEIKKGFFFRDVTCTVTGYPVSITGFTPVPVPKLDLSNREIVINEDSPLNPQIIYPSRMGGTKGEAYTNGRSKRSLLMYLIDPLGLFR